MNTKQNIKISVHVDMDYGKPKIDNFVNYAYFVWHSSWKHNIKAESYN